MSVSVNPPKTPVTKGSSGIAAATIPNVCKMPGPPAPFVPVPLPNIGKSGDSPKGYSKKVKIEGNTVAIKGATFKSMGDIASKGTGGGLISANTHGPTKFVGPGSMDVKIEGKNVQLLSDPMLNNCGPSGSPPNAATLVGLLQMSGLVALVGDEFCPLCDETHGDEGKLEESPDTKSDSDKLRDAAEAAVAKARDEREKIVEKLNDEAEKKAQEKYYQKKTKLEGQKDAAPESVKGKIQGIIDNLKQDDFYSQPQCPPEASIGTMLGVVHCKDGKVYAGKSSRQYTELYDAIDKAWHTPVASSSILETDAEFPDACETYVEKIKDPTLKEAFRDQWDVAAAMNDYCNALTPEQQQNQEPYYPPGQCAAQQMILLTLDHGGRPVGLTERWYKADDPTAAVRVRVRDYRDSEGRMGDFGGDQAVPPCGTCQIILTMLMCPKERAPKCQHETPKKEVCKCNP